MNKFLEVLGNIINAFFNKLDKLSNNVKDKTGIKINFGAILAVIFMFIVIVIIAKGVLGWVMGSLTGK